MHGWWVSDLWSISPVLMIAWAGWVIVSITLHELSHGWAAISRGDRTPIEMGHMTFNPVVHMGSMSLIAFALLGIAWGMMPVNPSRMRGRYSDAFVAAAGPAMNVALAILNIVLLVAWSVAVHSSLGSSIPAHIQDNAMMVFRAGALLNVVLVLFNLLPIPPLDGSRIAANFFPSYARLFEGPQGQYVGLGLFVVMWLFGFSALFGAAAWTVDTCTTILLIPFV